MHYFLPWLWVSNICKHALHNDPLAGCKITSCCLSWKKNEELWKHSDKIFLLQYLLNQICVCIRQRQLNVKVNFSGQDKSDSLSKENARAPGFPDFLIWIGKTYCSCIDQTVCLRRRQRLHSQNLRVLGWCICYSFKSFTIQIGVREECQQTLYWFCK